MIKSFWILALMSLSLAVSAVTPSRTDDDTPEDLEYRDALPPQGNGTTSNWNDERQMQEEAPRSKSSDYENEDFVEDMDDELDSDY